MTYANIEITFFKFVEFLWFLSFVGTWNTKVQKSKEMRGTNPFVVINCVGNYNAF